MNNTILILDNSKENIYLCSILLSNEGFSLITAEKGEEALSKVDETIDLIIMDLKLKDENGIFICKALREKTNAPILILSENSDESIKGLAFSAGADDYITKPFSSNELTYRAKALIRRYCTYKGRGTKNDGSVIKIKHIEVDLSAGTVLSHGNFVPLTTTEFDLLALMIKERKKIFTYEEIFDKIWHEPYLYKANNTIMVHIRKLRKKLEADPKNPEIIKTAWGKGYYID